MCSIAYDVHFAGKREKPNAVKIIGISLASVKVSLTDGTFIRIYLYILHGQYCMIYINYQGATCALASSLAKCPIRSLSSTPWRI